MHTLHSEYSVREPSLPTPASQILHRHSPSGVLHRYTHIYSALYTTYLQATCSSERPLRRTGQRAAGLKQAGGVVLAAGPIRRRPGLALASPLSHAGQAASSEWLVATPAGPRETQTHARSFPNAHDMPS